MFGTIRKSRIYECSINFRAKPLKQDKTKREGALARKQAVILTWIAVFALALDSPP